MNMTESPLRKILINIGVSETNINQKHQKAVLQRRKIGDEIVKLSQRKDRLFQFGVDSIRSGNDKASKISFAKHDELVKKIKKLLDKEDTIKSPGDAKFRF